MRKKPFIVGEAAAPYAAKKPVKGTAVAKTAESGVRYMDEATFRKSADRVFKVHKELFRKLAQ